MRFAKLFSTVVVSLLLLSSTSLLFLPAQAASLTPIYLSFEDNDSIGALAGSFATPTKKQGYWLPGAKSSIAPTVPDGHEGSALQFVKGKGEQLWSGITLIDAVPMTSATLNVISLDYFSPDSSPVELKLETSKGNTGSSVAKALNAVPGWNQLTFDMSKGKGWSTSTVWTRLSIIPDFKSETLTSGLVSAQPVNDQKYYIDNVSINGGTITDVGGSTPTPDPTPTPSALPVYMNFESNDGYGAAIGSYIGGLGAFEGGKVEVASSVAGRSDKALKFTKQKSGKSWSGFVALLPSNQLRVTTGSLPSITFDYYASDVSPVTLELQTADGTKVQSVKAASVGWHTMSFDMSKASGWDGNAVWQQLAIFPDYSSNVADNLSPNDQVYYLDNISVNGGTISDVGNPVAASPTPSSNACINKPALRLLTPNVSDATQNNSSPTYWGGADQYNDPDTMVYVHYYPVGSTISVTYQAYDEKCKPYGANVDVFLAVNAQYSGSQTSFVSTDSDGAITVAKPFAKDCVPPFCAGDQTILSQKTNAQGQVTFVLVNTNKTSPENKPTDINQVVPGGDVALGSNFSPSFHDFTPGVNNAPATGAGGSNKQTAEAIDRLLPHFVNGLGGVTAPADVTAVKGTAKSLTFTVRDTSGQIVRNANVRVTTDDGGALTSPDSSTGTPDIYGFTTVDDSTDANGNITVTASAANTGSQIVTVSYTPTTGDASLKALNGSTKITWASAPVKVAQTIGAVAASVKLKTSITLPAKTSKALTIKWTTTTPKFCSISAGKVKGLKIGTCKVTGTNAGNGTTKAVTKTFSISVKK